MSLTEKEIYDLNNRNVASQNVSLGNILSNKSGEALTEKQIYDLNNDNVITQKLKFGEIVNAIATGNAGSLEDLTDEEQEALNNIDISFKNALVGDYVQVIIDESGGDTPEQPLSARLFAFNNGVIVGFSSEGQQLYDDGELTELFLPNSYSIESNYQEDITLTDANWNDFDQRKDIFPFWYEYNGRTYTSNQKGDSAYIRLMNAVCLSQETIIVHTDITTYKDGNDYMVTSVGNNAFEGKTLLTSLTSNNPNLVSLGRGAFVNCSELTTVDLSECTADNFGISYTAFQGCTQLTNLSFPTKLTTIESEAFASTGLTNIVVPATVTSIDGTTFRNCTHLTSLTVEVGNSNFDSRDNCNAVIETATNTLVLGCITTVIPNTVSIIGLHALSNIAFTSIEIPSSVSTIESNAFAETGLTSITIPSTVDSIGSACFIACLNLTTVNIQNPDIQIDSDVFGNCNSLTAINYAGTKLQWDNLPFKNEFIYLTQQITVHCIDGDIIYNEPAGNMILEFRDGTSQEFLVPKDFVDFNLYQDADLTQLRKISLPEGVVKIYDSAFSSLYGTNIRIHLPSTLTEIGNEAFYIEDSIIKEIKCEALTPPILGELSFGSNESGQTYSVYVPSSTYADYQVASGWVDLYQENRLQAITE